MPTVLRVDGYRFFFYRDEGNPREPPHIHAVSGEKSAKFWLDPAALVNSKRIAAPEIAALQRLVTRHRDRFLEARHDHFDPCVRTDGDRRILFRGRFPRDS